MLNRLRSAAHGREDTLAIGSEAGTATFGQLLATADAITRFLAPHTLVLLAMPGGPTYTAIEYGGFAAGAVVAPIPDKSTARETRAFLAVVRPDVVFVSSLAAQHGVLDALGGPGELDDLDEPVTIVVAEGPTGRHGAHRVVALAEVLAGSAGRPRAAADHQVPAQARMIQFTSGSTSTPKGIVLSAANLLANLDQNAAHLTTFCGRAVFCPVPQFHAMGGAVVFEHLAFGSPVLVANRFVPGDDLANLQKHHCVGILASPNYFKLTLKLGMLDPKRLPDLAMFTIGTAAIDPGLISDLRSRFPDARIHCRYGLSEALGAMTRLDLEPGRQLDDPGMVGPLVPGLEFAPGMMPPGEGEPAEIKVRGGTVAIGRLAARGHYEPLSDADGYLATGDLGHLDAKGRLHLRGRISTFLKSNGHRINPFEIEALLREVAGVHDAVVVGTPDPLAGQRIVACIEATPGHLAPTHEELLTACLGQLAAYKIPTRFVIVDQLPRTPAGKPDRTRIQEETAR